MSAKQSKVTYFLLLMLHDPEHYIKLPNEPIQHSNVCRGLCQEGHLIVILLANYNNNKYNKGNLYLTSAIF